MGRIFQTCRHEETSPEKAKEIATINKKGVLKGKKCGDCEVIAILDTGVKLRVPLRVDAGNLSFDPDTGEFIRY